MYLNLNRHDVARNSFDVKAILFLNIHKYSGRGSGGWRGVPASCTCVDVTNTPQRFCEIVCSAHWTLHTVKLRSLFYRQLALYS